MKALSSVEVMEPKEARFKVETSIQLVRAPKWTLNGRLLSPCPEIRIEREGTSNKLIFTKTDSSMCGTVQFISGKSKTEAQLTVTGNEICVCFCHMLYWLVNHRSFMKLFTPFLQSAP